MLPRASCRKATRWTTTSDAGADGRQLLLSYEILLERLDGGQNFDTAALEEAAASICTNGWLNEPPAEAEATTGGL